MTPTEIEMILGRLKSRAPPNDMDVLRFVLSLPWSGDDDYEIEMYTEIILRLTADAIVAKFINDDSMRNEYMHLFNEINNKKISKKLISNREFFEYYSKFKIVVLSI